MSFGMQLLRFLAFAPTETRQYLLGAGGQNFGECGLGNKWYYNYGNPYVQQMPAVYEFTPPDHIDVNTAITDPDEWKLAFGAYQHVIAIKNDGTLWATGDNTFGQIGTGVAGGVQRYFAQVLVPDGNNIGWLLGGGGTEHSAALRSDGTVWCWGRNDISSACGNGAKTPANIVIPHNVHTTDSDHRCFDLATRFIDLRVGHRFNIGMDENRNLWSWGNNGSRQLGRDFIYLPTEEQPNFTQDTYIRRTPSIDPRGNGRSSASPCTEDAAYIVPGPWAEFSAGAYHAGAIHQDGMLWMWGLNGNNQCGDGASSQLPRQIASPRPGVKWSRIFCGEYSTAAILEDGSLWLWGKNDSGQLGLGDTLQRAAPTQQPGSWKFCQTGLKSGCGIKTDGTFWVWGSNQNGLIGLGSSVAQALNPTQIGADTTWTQAYPMNLSTLALKKV